jgi:hypothetical protein
MDRETDLLTGNETFRAACSLLKTTIETKMLLTETIKNNRHCS